jgi:glutathione peroxidase
LGNNHLSFCGYSFSIDCTGVDGSQLPLKEFESKVALIVNTASLCRFTHQYEAIEETSQKYRN